jgi:hypothetical protein
VCLADLLEKEEFTNFRTLLSRVEIVINVN